MRQEFLCFKGWITFHWRIYHILCIYSSNDGHLGCFHRLAIVNKYCHSNWESSPDDFLWNKTFLNPLIPCYPYYWAGFGLTTEYGITTPHYLFLTQNLLMFSVLIQSTKSKAFLFPQECTPWDFRRKLVRLKWQPSKVSLYSSLSGKELFATFL